MLDNVPRFESGEHPTADKMNALRDGIVSLLSGGITGANLSWPLRAEGTLDMNGNDIINLNSMDGAIHVNSTRSIQEAVNQVNAEGGGTIVIDVGYTAVAPSTGLTITADNVTIMGIGNSSVLNLGADSKYGLILDGDNFTLKNLLVTTAADTATFEAAICARATGAQFLSVTFSSPSETVLRLGDGGTQARDIVVDFCIFQSAANHCINLHNVVGFTFSECISRDNAGDFVRIESTASTISSGTITGCAVNTSSATGGGFVSALAATSGAQKGIHISGTHFNCYGGGTSLSTAGLQQCTVNGSGCLYTGGITFGGLYNEYICIYNDVPTAPVTFGTLINCLFLGCRINQDFVPGTASGVRIVNCEIIGSGGAWAIDNNGSGISTIIGNTVTGNVRGCEKAGAYGLNVVSGTELYY
jgi:hypothetical protein